MNTSFSAYWPVENNTKYSAGKHLKSASNKKLDYFFTENDCSGFKNINLKFEDLPSHKYIKNLTALHKHYKQVYLKFTHLIQADAFIRLATIWTSKVLLFEYMLKYTNSEYIMWVDCVHASNVDLISATCSDKCIINRYPANKLRGQIFGQMIENNLPPVKILAQVIKLPRHIVPDFIKKYIECLQFTDDNFIIYDEEVVLTLMHEKYPDLFSIIN